MKKLLLKLIPLFAALLCTASLFCSCANESLTVTITENGGTLSYEYYVKKELADKYFNGEMPTGLKNCEIDEINNEICYVYSETFASQNFNELNEKLCSINLYGEEGFNVFSFASVNNRNLTLTVNPFITEDIKNIALIQGIEIETLAKLSLKITMPYDIEEYSDGILSEDKKTITLELTEFDTNKSIDIKCVAEILPPEPSKLPLILSIIGGSLGILTIIGITIIVCVFMIRKRKRKQAEAMPDIPIDKI